MPGKILMIAFRNLMRYKRRTLLTSSIVAIGVIFVLLFVALSGSFKNTMISEITDSMLGHLQVHRRGYLASSDSLPLNLNLSAGQYEQAAQALESLPGVDSFSPRIRFGGMFSTFVESTNIRLNGVYPEREFETVPLLPSRVVQGTASLDRGEILVPVVLARAMQVKPGDTVVIVSTNKDGSVNGMRLTVAGVLESVTGPGGRDGYIHIQDAAELLRMEEMEVSEVAVRLKDFSALARVKARLEEMLSHPGGGDPQAGVTGENLEAVPGRGMPAGEEAAAGARSVYEVHTWDQLSPFSNIAKTIDLMTASLTVILVAVVLISIMNVMIMAVYERIREIGTIAAIGTLPGRILSLFLAEGFFLGAMGAAAGNLIGGLALLAINQAGITFGFGKQQLVLRAAVDPWVVAVISAVVLVVSVAASLEPAFKASRMDPIKALRHV